jgi:hypothetical protein
MSVPMGMGRPLVAFCQNLELWSTIGTGLGKALHALHRGTSLTRKRTPLGPFRKPMPRVLGGS